jgi:DNA polymerase III epsilon subunit-like protein
VKLKNKPWLCIDIETSTQKAEFYGSTYEPKIVRVTEEAHMLGFSVKWYGEKKIYVYDLKDFKGSEIEMLKKVLGWIEQCEYFIAHNGDKFDLRFINARLDKFKLPVISPIKTVDTLKIARKLWNLPSYRLDFLGWYFGLGRKMERPHVEDRPLTERERKQEKSYNGNDVLILEKLFTLQLPHIGHLPMFKIPKAKTNISEDRTCPKMECRSNRTQSRGRRVFEGKICKQYQCMTCFRWFYSRK